MPTEQWDRYTLMIRYVTQCVQSNYFPNLAVVRMGDFQSVSNAFSELLHRHFNEFVRLCEDLEHALLRVSTFRSLSLLLPLANRHTTRTLELRLQPLFATLRRRNSFFVEHADGDLHMRNDHLDLIATSCLSPDARWAISSDVRSTIFWECRTGTPKAQWDRQFDYSDTDYMPSFPFSPDGRLCARPAVTGASSQSCVVIWDTEKDQHVATLNIGASESMQLHVDTTAPSTPRVMTIIWGSSGTIALFEIYQDTLSAQFWVMTIWDSTTYTVCNWTVGQEGEDLYFRVSPNRDFLVCGSNDYTLSVLNTSTSEWWHATIGNPCANLFTTDGGPVSRDTQCHLPVMNVEFIDGGDGLVCFCPQCRTAYLWDLTRRSSESVAPEEPHHILLDAQPFPHTLDNRKLGLLAISPDGTLTAFLWRDEEDPLSYLEGSMGIFFIPTSRFSGACDRLRQLVEIDDVNDGCFSPSGEHFVLTRRGGIDIYRTGDGKCITTLKAPSGLYFLNVVISEDGETIAAATWHTLRFYRFRDVIQSAESELASGTGSC